MLMLETNGSSPSLEDVRSVLEQGEKHPVLLYIPARKKGPVFPGWPKITYEQTQDEHYQKLLREHPNTGVLLGEQSGDLEAIDLDTEALLEAFLALNPALQGTLRTRGARGAQLWAYFTGPRPRQVHPLKVHKDSPLTAGMEFQRDKKTGQILDYQTVGEFRAEGGQSVVRGIHPSGCDYTWLVANPPITIAFEETWWPTDILIPWESERKAGEDSATDDLLKRAIAKLSVDWLWNHFGFPERGKANPTASPFRTDNTQGHPSFSIYDEGRRFKDHNSAYSQHRGDSFDFYQLATGQDSHQAFKPFVELAGLGRELVCESKTGQSEKDKAEVELTDDELRELDKAELERYRLKDRPFPSPMSEEAFIGVAGEIVKIIQPVSEPSREAILAQFLVAFGNMIGRGPHRKQAGIHRLNEFAVLVGQTAIARKGTSWAAIDNLLTAINEDWLSARMRTDSSPAKPLCTASGTPNTGQFQSISAKPAKPIKPKRLSLTRALAINGS